MARGASVNMQPCRSPASSHIHNARVWDADHPAPAYLLPPEHSLGAWEVIQAGDAIDEHARLMEMASPQARRDPKFSPLWEAVLNLDHPIRDGADRERYDAQVRAFAGGYETITGHKVLNAHVHADEGRLGLDGQPIYNAHAHLVIDRCDERGRVIKLDRTQLRAIQDLAAETTGLERGIDARTSKRQHLDHGSYRTLAREGLIRSRDEPMPALEADNRIKQLEAERIKANAYIAASDNALATAKQKQAAADQRIRDLNNTVKAVENRAEKAEEKLKAAETYRLLREAMKESGDAKQLDYKQAKARYDAGDHEWVNSAAEEWIKKAASKQAAESTDLDVTKMLLKQADEALTKERLEHQNTKTELAQAKVPPAPRQLAPFVDAWNESRDPYQAAELFQKAYLDQSNARKAAEEERDAYPACLAAVTSGEVSGTAPNAQRPGGYTVFIGQHVADTRADQIAALFTARIRAALGPVLDAYATARETAAHLTALMVHLAKRKEYPSPQFPWHDPVKVREAATRLEQSAHPALPVRTGGAERG